MNVRWIAPSLLLVAGPASAQTAAVLGTGDVDFARKLFNRGYADMAEQLCTLIEKSGKLSGREEVGVKSLHIDLRLELAKKEADPLKKKDLVKQVLEDKEGFIHSYQGSPEADEAS